MIGAPSRLAAQRVAGYRILVRQHAVELDREACGFRQVKVHAGIVRPDGADAAFDPSAKFAAGCPADHRQRTAFGVAAKQRSLRTLKHFDPFDIEQRGVKAVLAAEVNAVDIDADTLFARGLVGIERHDPADPDRQRRLPRFKGGNTQAGNSAVGQIEQALHLALTDRIGAHHRDRDRGALQVGFALGGGDDDIGQAGVRRGVAGVFRRCIAVIGGGRRTGGILICGTIDGYGVVGNGDSGEGRSGVAQRESQNGKRGGRAGSKAVHRVFPETVGVFVLSQDPV